MIIVSNASPLIALIRIGQLDLLHQLYSEIIIPEAVWHEVVLEGADQSGAEVVSSASWIVRRTMTNKPLVHGLQQELDAGEAEAIALASGIPQISCAHL
jgi:predicted nucleic acid-binding protein